MRERGSYILLDNTSHCNGILLAFSARSHWCKQISSGIACDIGRQQQSFDEFHDIFIEGHLNNMVVLCSSLEQFLLAPMHNARGCDHPFWHLSAISRLDVDLFMRLLKPMCSINYKVIYILIGLNRMRLCLARPSTFPSVSSLCCGRKSRERENFSLFILIVHEFTSCTLGGSERAREERDNKSGLQYVALKVNSINCRYTLLSVLPPRAAFWQS